MYQNIDPRTPASIDSEGIINKLQETEHRVDVGWKVEDLLEKFGDSESIFSPVFKWCSYCWYIQMNFTEKEFELFLVKSMSVNPIDTVFRCGIELADGTSEMRCYLMKKFDWPEDGFGTNEFIQMSELRERENELLPDGHLTVLCSVGLRTSFTKPDRIKYKGDMSASQSILSPRIWRNFLECSEKCEILSESVDLLASLENLSHDLRLMFVNMHSPDVHLTCGINAYSAHKVVLAARSKVFAAKFQRDTFLSLEINDMDPSVFKAFLIFLYCGRISLSQDTVTKLYKAGEKYDVHSLKNLCANFMLQNMREDNFLTYLIFANTCKDKEYRNAVICAIAKDVRLLKCEAWLAFSRDRPELANETYRAYFRK